MLAALDELDAHARCSLLLGAEGRADYRIAQWLGEPEPAVTENRERAGLAICSAVGCSREQLLADLRRWCDPRASLERSDIGLRRLPWRRRVPVGWTRVTRTGRASEPWAAAQLGTRLARDLMMFAVLPEPLPADDYRAAVERVVGR